MTAEEASFPWRQGTSRSPVEATDRDRRRFCGRGENRFSPGRAVEASRLEGRRLGGLENLGRPDPFGSA